MPYVTRDLLPINRAIIAQQDEWSEARGRAKAAATATILSTQDSYVNILKKIQDAKEYADLSGKTVRVKFATDPQSESDWDSIPSQSLQATYLPHQYTVENDRTAEGMVVLPDMTNSDTKTQERIFDTYSTWDSDENAYQDKDDKTRYMRIIK